jgi:hypothetical protein
MNREDIFGAENAEAINEEKATLITILRRHIGVFDEKLPMESESTLPRLTLTMREEVHRHAERVCGRES